MSHSLTFQQYGKSSVRLTKVVRHTDRHDLVELNVSLSLQGGFDEAYTRDSNEKVIPTDTMKNTVYCLGCTEEWSDIESFAQILANHFLTSFAHVSQINVTIEETLWQRLPTDKTAHPHAFIGSSREQRTCRLSATRNKVDLTSGIAGLELLKTTDSAFAGFLNDQFTTLAETDDRIFATTINADWRYSTTADYRQTGKKTRDCLLQVFGSHNSPSVQSTLYLMGQTILDACPVISEITLSMPNQHRLLVDLRPFNIENRNVVFCPVDEPYGDIRATLRRAD